MKWKTLEHTPEPPRRQYVTDDRRPERPAPKTPRRQCAWCGVPVTWGDTCLRKDSRCFYHHLAAGAGVTLPDSSAPMIVRHEPPVASDGAQGPSGGLQGHEPPMMLCSLAEIAAQASEGRAA